MRSENTMRIGAIWAQGHGRALGKDGTIPWHLPEDLRLFRQITTGHPVIMGRSTWESLPERMRPLPQRTNIVLTRTKDYRTPGAHRANSIDQALDIADNQGSDFCWIIGGAQIYQAFLEHCDLIVVTKIDLEVPDADTFAPHIPREWMSHCSTQLTSISQITYQICSYTNPASAISNADINQLLPHISFHPTL
ncbi:dihydrofolate reductase [Arcanobacterium pinnipediorum]|uniref:Dihydrofolate reductase n=1 Tax=Arcanobacterium pinnipediorum TaxID=1503041 RepID=A0ABY5AHV3_9ACTO|nr:dihydrofolate reductase [Arcanobacterium pinnipediorum]USR79774.1 dihydrofolate reductase [Arcanobacterium pinnipediorum]